MSKLKELEDLLPIFSALDFVTGGVECIDVANGIPTKRFVSNTQLLQIDPLLPTGLRLMSAEKGALRGNDAQRLLQLWQSDVHLVSARHELLAYVGMRKVRFWDDSVSFTGSGFQYTKIDDAETGNVLLIPGYDAPVVAEVKKDWLDRTSPGWLLRYELTQELGTSLIDSVRAMITSQPTVAHCALPLDFSS